MARVHGTVTAYDAVYVALAELLDAPLVNRYRGNLYITLHLHQDIEYL
jgi:hypothetical protein